METTAFSSCETHVVVVGGCLIPFLSSSFPSIKGQTLMILTSPVIIKYTLPKQYNSLLFRKIKMKHDHHSPAPVIRRESSDNLLGRSRNYYKIWVLAAILLLAFCSMLTGSVTLHWSAGNLLNPLPDHDLYFQPLDDLDILEVEEKEKMVRRMWEVYTHSSSMRLPRFWQQAFEAAYESLASDVASVRDAAISEIAKISVLSMNLDPVLPHQSTRVKQIPTKEGKIKSSKQMQAKR